jgi:hypothetical protein
MQKQRRCAPRVYGLFLSSENKVQIKKTPGLFGDMGLHGGKQIQREIITKYPQGVGAQSDL